MSNIIWAIKLKHGGVTAIPKKLKTAGWQFRLLFSSRAGQCQPRAGASLPIIIPG